MTRIQTPHTHSFSVFDLPEQSLFVRASAYQASTLAGSFLNYATHLLFYEAGCRFRALNAQFRSLFYLRCPFNLKIPFKRLEKMLDIYLCSLKKLSPTSRLLS